MRTTICELPHTPAATAHAWSELAAHCQAQCTELLVLPEFAFLEPIWEHAEFDQARWSELERQAQQWLGRLTELGCAFVIGAMPATVAGQRLNQGFLWSRAGGVSPLRGKRHLPDEPGGWEARWFARGPNTFPVFSAGRLKFGLNICSELWALETFGPYARAGAHAVVTPRATAAATTERWMALAKTVAVRTGAYSLSSNRRHDDGSCGGVGWVIDPEGRELARTSATCPACTVDIDLSVCEAAQASYPRYVFAQRP